jgi:hypothetical protein
MVGAALLVAAAIIGLATVAGYGFGVDEFNADDYGPKALAWYTSLGADRSHLETVEPFLWYYGPWPQILTAIAQSFNLTDPITVRHAVTFLVGLAGLAALIPIARVSVGAWAGPLAILLCLATGYLYGSLFFTPIDVPFLAAMAWAVCAIVMMARRDVPSWPASVAAGLLTGLAMATRPAGIITHAYLVAAMALCALDVLIRKRREAKTPLLQIAGRTLATMAVAWITMVALWPWLQIGNPLRQFAAAYSHFTHNPMDFTFPHWGEEVSTRALPWSYIPGQLLARLPASFLVLLALALVVAIVAAIRLGRGTVARLARQGVAGVVVPALVLARRRGTLLVAAAAIVPIAFVMITHATHYDGIRHLLFVIPMLALLAAGALLQVVPVLRRYPPVAVAVVALAIAQLATSGLTLLRLHPFEYVAINALAGGTQNAAGRFELDYWGVAASEAIRILERRLDRDTSGRFASSPPRVRVCLKDRDWTADTLFRRNWIAETDPDRADFIIDTERWPCGRETDAVLIGQVERLGVTLARIYADNRGRGIGPEPLEAGLAGNAPERDSLPSPK